MWGIFRLFLALTVVVCHARFRVFEGHHLLAPARAAVEMFFTISGFVITRAVRSHYSHSGGFIRFWQNRALRLMPPYWLALAVGVGLAYLGYPLFAPHGRNWLSAIFVVGQTGLFAGSFAATVPLIVSWTLAVEVFYYFVLSALAARSRRHARTFLLAACGLAAVALAGVPARPAYFGIAWQAFPFAAGCWLAWNTLPKIGRSAAWAVLAVSAAYVWFSPDLTVAHYGAALVASAAIVACESVPPIRFERFIADLSYPVYIIQFPATALVLTLHGWAFVAAAPFATLAAGIAINRLVEVPLSRIRARIRAPGTAPMTSSTQPRGAIPTSASPMP